jgi:Tfp pilus assembly protein PilX
MQYIFWIINNSRGSVLIVGLFTLSLLTLLGVAATSTSRTDVSITGNRRVIQESFYASEVGLAAGEQLVNSKKSHSDFDSITGYYAIGKQDLSMMKKWDGTNAIEVQVPAPFKPILNNDHPPRYTIEERPFKLAAGVKSKKLGTNTGIEIHHYNITSRAMSNNPSCTTCEEPRTETILRTVFAVRFK